MMTGLVRQRVVAVIGAWLMCLSTAHAQTIDITRYAWEFPSVAGVTGATPMITRLQEEVQKVLDAGRLTPMRAYYGSKPSMGEEYWLYIQPGRIITTLAWAYPYLTTAQQAGVKSYVAAELASATHAPWANSPMPVTAGTTRRELHPLSRVTYITPAFANTHPSVHTLYGLWLYAYRTGDWALIQSNWSTIQSMYAARSGQGNIYGTMGAHIAMARMAHKFGTPSVETTALNNLQAQLNAGLNFAAVENIVKTSYWAYFYSTPAIQSGVYEGWMFLNLSPEIARYLAANVSSATLARHTSGKARFPLWWMRQANYATSWTGLESVGIPTEMMGMVVPIERWVVGASAATLRDYVRSAPICIGDSYWLESLVQAIEATGNLVWVDARIIDGSAPRSPTGLKILPPG
jgi:hypothetical protein